MTNHQRIGAISNAHAGREFEALARVYFHEQEGLRLQQNFPVPIGHAGHTKIHRFDLGSEDPAVLVECKSHNWTVTGNMPSAKVTVWNEAMYYFLTAPSEYKKVMFVLHDLNIVRSERLLAYYLKTYAHLIPAGIEFWEYNEETGVAIQVGI